MRKKLKSSDVISHIGKLAFGKSNDAVRLIFLGSEEQGLVDELDLSMVSEVKRGAKGEVEVKLLNKIALLELLARLLSSDPAKRSGAESFFNAMDRAAAKIPHEDA